MRKMGLPDFRGHLFVPGASEIVADIVRNLRLDVHQAIKQYADEQLDKEDRQAFAEIVQEEIKRLHKGIIARYRIRPSEFEAWLKARNLA